MPVRNNVQTLSREEATLSSSTKAIESGASSEQQFVKGLGLTSATTLVMGSMIGSGIFIVSADISRLVESPALLLAAWMVTGVMTIICALCYGELAAMMPHAGGQYVYLRESLGPIWGFLYGWTLFLVIQTGTIAAVGVAFGKFLGIFVPAVSSSHWLIHIAHVPPVRVGAMVLGNMDVGLSTQNLTAIVIIVLLSVVNIFGVKLGAAVQNVFTIAKTAALLGLVVLGIFIGRNATAIAANFGANFWRHAAFHAMHPVQVGVGGPIVLVGTIAIVAVAQVGSLFSADAWNNVTFTAGEVKNPQRNLPLSLAIGTGVVILLYILANVVYLAVLPLAGDPTALRFFPRHSVRFGRPRRYRRGAADLWIFRCWHYGHRHSGFSIRLHQRNAAGGRARLLRHGQRWLVLRRRGKIARALSHTGARFGVAVHLDLHPVRFGELRPASRLHHFRRADVLYFDHRRPDRAAREAAQRASSLSRYRLPVSARDLHSYGHLY